MSCNVQQQLNEWGKSNIPFVFLIDYECEAPLCWKLEEANEAFKFNFQGISNFKKINTNMGTEFNKGNKNINLHKIPISFEDYNNKFNFVKSEIEYGNSFLVNLTTATKIETNLNIEDIAYSCNSKYTCYLKNKFVSFSPESFVQIKEGKIYAYPMKGTIDASIANAKEIILNDNKEIAEHATIVDLIRNDLNLVAEKVSVNKYRYYEEIETNSGIIGQVSSEISGILPTDYKAHIGDILFKLLPAGSISGAPKEKTKTIIAKAEKEKRGYYTGVAGYFDGNNLDSCVLIRYLQSNFIYRSGGGITALSDVTKEYQEMIDKVYVPAF